MIWIERFLRFLQTGAPRRFWCILACGTIIGFAAVFYGPVFSQGQTVSAFDLCYFKMPAYHGLQPPQMQRASNELLSDSVTQMQAWDFAAWRGPLRFPWLWNPYAAFGAPFLGNAISAVLNPLKHLVYALFGVAWGFGWLCFLKMALAGLFMAAYLGELRLGWPSRLLGAISFMACGFMVVWAQWPQTSAAIFLPLFLLASEYLLTGRYRGGIILLAGITACSVLSGHPETSFHEIITGAFYLVCRRVWLGRAMPEAACEAPHTVNTAGSAPPPDRRRIGFNGILLFAGAVLLGALIAALQIIPTAEYLLGSAKLAARTAEAGTMGTDVFRFWSAGWPSAYRELLTYIVPTTSGNPSWHTDWWNKNSNFNESAGYVGAGIFLMAILAWRFFGTDSRARALCLLQLLALGFILKVTLVQATLGALPILNVTANKRLLLVFCFTNAALAAILLDALWKSRLRSRGFGMALVLILLLMIGLAGHDYFHRFANNPQAWLRAYGIRQAIHCLVFLLPFGVLALMPWWTARMRTAVALGLVALTAIDLWIIHYRYNPFIDCDRLYPVTPAIRWLQDSGVQPRVLPMGTQILPNLTTIFGIQDARIYDAVTVTTYDRYMRAMGAVSDWYVIYQRVPLRLASIASIQWVCGGSRWQPDQKDLMARYGDKHTTIYENTNALPRAFVASSWDLATSPEEAIQKLMAPDFPWRSRVIVEREPRLGSFAIDWEPSHWLAKLSACCSKYLPCPPFGCDPLPDSAVVPTPGNSPNIFRPATIAKYEPTRVEIQLPLTHHAGGLLVLNDTWYPGWAATVDGKQHPIYRVNGVFRGVAIAPGNRCLVFEYRPGSFHLGIVLSGIGLLAWGTLLIGFMHRSSCCRAQKIG